MSSEQTDPRKALPTLMREKFKIGYPSDIHVMKGCTEG